MDPREMVEITFRLPLEALGRLSPLLEAAGQGMTREQPESGEGASFDEKQFEAVRAGEPELLQSRPAAAEEPVLLQGEEAAAGEPELLQSREAAVGEPELSQSQEAAAGEPELPKARVAESEEPGLPESRWTERLEPALLEEAAELSREIQLGESVRQEWDVSTQRLFQGTVETVRTAEVAERTGEGISPRALSALWERDARRYDGGFSLK